MTYASTWHICAPRVECYLRSGAQFFTMTRDTLTIRPDNEFWSAPERSKSAVHSSSFCSSLSPSLRLLQSYVISLLGQCAATWCSHNVTSLCHVTRHRSGRSHIAFSTAMQRHLYDVTASLYITWRSEYSSFHHWQCLSCLVPSLYL